MIYLVIAILALLAVFFIWKKFFYKGADYTRDETEIFTPKQATPSSNAYIKKSKLGKIDILKSLKYQSEILYEECTKYDSTIFVKFPNNLPRIYSDEVINITNAIYDVCEFFLQNISEPVRIRVDFSTKEIKQSAKTIKLNISVGIDKELKDAHVFALKTAIMNAKSVSGRYITSAQKHLGELGSIVNFDTNANGTFIKINATCTYYDEPNELRTKQYNYKILIAHKSREIFDDLKAFFENVGCDVVPNMSWENAKKHLDDYIYKPDLVVIDTEILRNDVNVISYLNAIGETDVRFAFLLKNKHSNKPLKNLKLKFFKLEMPYFHDEFYAVLDLVKQMKSDEHFLDIN